MQERLSTTEAHNNIWKFYFFKIFSNSFFIVPIAVLFWQSNGLSMMQIMILQSLFAISVVFLEVPTGYFADIFGRKKTLMLGGIFTTFGMFVYSLSRSFHIFLIAEIFFAFGISFISGSDSAFLYDTLKDVNKEDSYKKIWGNSIFYGLCFLAFANIVGGFLGKINLRWPFYVSFLFLALSIPAAMSMKEPKRHKLIFEKGYIWNLFGVIKEEVVRNKKIKWLIIYSGVVVGFNQAALWLYQPYFKLTGLDIFYFGIVFAAFQVVAAISSKYAHKIEKKLGQKSSLVMLAFLVSISFFLMHNFIYLFSFSFAFIHQFVRGFSKIVFDDYINKLTTSEMRATVLSVQSLSTRLFYAFIIPIVGWIVDIYSLTQALLVLAVTSLVCGVSVLIVMSKLKVLSKNQIIASH